MEDRMWRHFLNLACALSLVACSSPRKLSQVGLREPAALRDGPVVTALRQETIALEDFAKACPAELKTEFSALAAERVQFPACPEGFNENFQNSLMLLKLEERSTLEEVLGSQCRSLGLGEFGDSLEQLYTTFETTGPLGRRSIIKESFVSNSPDLQALASLKGSLEEIVGQHLPLERWARRYGAFVLPEEDLRYLHGLIVKRGCRVGEEEVDEAYRSIRGLEDLAKILKEGPLRTRIETLLAGVHKVIDRRIQEYFQP
jgi:hypothetical protein